jgi:hypothetical protein
MDEHLSPSSCSRPAPFSFSEASCTILELPSFEVPEQWLLADVVAAGENENDDIGACLGETPAAAGGVLSPADSELSNKLLLRAPRHRRRRRRSGGGGSQGRAPARGPRPPATWSPSGSAASS